MTKHTQILRAEHEAAKHTPDKRFLYFLRDQYVGVTYSPEATGMLEPRASEYTFIPVSQCAAAPDLLAALEDLLGPNPDTHEVNGRYECRHCGREWSAMCGDNEVPENCPSDDCPGFIARAAINKAKTL